MDRALAEYGASAAASAVIAETIGLCPGVENDAMPFGGDHRVGGYAPLAAATPT